MFGELYTTVFTGLLQASPLIFLIVPSLLPQGDDGVLQIEEECGRLDPELYSIFM